MIHLNKNYDFTKYIYTKSYFWNIYINHFKFISILYYIKYFMQIFGYYN